MDAHILLLAGGRSFCVTRRWCPRRDAHEDACRRPLPVALWAFQVSVASLRYPGRFVRARCDDDWVPTRSIQPGDLVMVNKRGRLYYARVLGSGAMGGLSVKPLDRRVSWRQATARKVVDHWTHGQPDRAERTPNGQLQLQGVEDL